MNIAANPAARLLPSNEKYTPTKWRDFAEQVFQASIELDPASCAEANEVIQAARFFTISDNALIRSWQAKTLWLNPPYSYPEIDQFSKKLIEELPRIEQAIVLVNSCTEAAWYQAMKRSCAAMLFPRGRINFWEAGGDPTNPKGRNEYRQTLFYFGPNPDRFWYLAEVELLLGEVVRPYSFSGGQTSDLPKNSETLSVWSLASGFGRSNERSPEKQIGEAIDGAIAAAQLQVDRLGAEGVAHSNSWLDLESKGDLTYWRLRWLEGNRKRSKSLKLSELADWRRKIANRNKVTFWEYRIAELQEFKRKLLEAPP
jgi:DNA N-6-adenine-methyltransferase (Dam)